MVTNKKSFRCLLTRFQETSERDGLSVLNPNRPTGQKLVARSRANSQSCSRMQQLANSRACLMGCGRPITSEPSHGEYTSCPFYPALRPVISEKDCHTSMRVSRWPISRTPAHTAGYKTSLYRPLEHMNKGVVPIRWT